MEILSLAVAEAVGVACPYCGEAIEVLVDGPEGSQQYFEDCTVCCRPIVVHAQVDADGVITVRVADEDAAWAG